MKLIVRCCVVVLSLVACLAIQAGVVFPAPGSNAVISLKGSLSGSFTGQGGVITASALTSGQIINLAQGRAPTTPVPANEVLALVINCDSGNTALTVYDTSARTNLVIIAIPSDNVIASSTTKAVVSYDLAVQNVGDSNNGFTDGFLVMVAAATLDVNGCPTKVKTTLSGGVNLNFTSFPVPVVITKGKLSGSRIDTLFVP